MGSPSPRVSLPATTLPTPSKRDPILLIGINGRPVTLAQLRAGLEEKKRESRKAIVHADAAAPVARLQDAINVAFDAGYEVAYATQSMR